MPRRIEISLAVARTNAWQEFWADRTGEPRVITRSIRSGRRTPSSSAYIPPTVPDYHYTAKGSVDFFQVALKLQDRFARASRIRPDPGEERLMPEPFAEFRQWSEREIPGHEAGNHHHSFAITVINVWTRMMDRIAPEEGHRFYWKAEFEKRVDQRRTPRDRRRLHRICRQAVPHLPPPERAELRPM
jgi:hypothetical protein